jgi:hypothetical protein
MFPPKISIAYITCFHFSNYIDNSIHSIHLGHLKLYQSKIYWNLMINYFFPRNSQVHQREAEARRILDLITAVNKGNKHYFSFYTINEKSEYDFYLKILNLTSCSPLYVNP